MTEREKERFDLSYRHHEGYWIWIRGQYADGYGQFTLNGKSKRAHRVSYEYTHSITLTPNQFLHHVCRNKLCINPSHLEITNQANHVDSATYGNKQKTHCPYGHEYTPENICWNNHGKQRECRICKYRRIRRRYYRKQKEAIEKLKEIALRCQNKTQESEVAATQRPTLESCIEKR